MLTSKVPPGSKTREASIINTGIDPLISDPQHYFPRIPKNILGVLMCALELNVSNRFSTMKEFQMAFLPSSSNFFSIELHPFNSLSEIFHGVKSLVIKDLPSNTNLNITLVDPINTQPDNTEISISDPKNSQVIKVQQSDQILLIKGQEEAKTESRIKFRVYEPKKIIDLKASSVQAITIINNNENSVTIKVEPNGKTPPIVIRNGRELVVQNLGSTNIIIIKK